MERRRLHLVVRLVSVGMEGDREVGDPDVFIGTLG